MLAASMAPSAAPAPTRVCNSSMKRMTSRDARISSRIFFESLLELTAVLGARDERAHVEREHALAHQRLGDVAEDDLLREALGDRGLADAGLADQRRVVLGAPAQDLHDALDLHRAPDHRIERVLDREVGQVTAELVEQRRLGRLLLRLLRTPRRCPTRGAACRSRREPSRGWRRDPRGRARRCLHPR